MQRMFNSWKSEKEKKKKINNWSHLKYSATVVTRGANPDDSQTSVFPCVDADLIKSAFGKRRNMILTCSSDGRGEPKMMTHFSAALGCQTH